MSETPSLGPPRVMGSKGKPFDVPGAISRYMKVIVVLGLGLFMLLAPLAFIMSKPFYEVSGSLRLTREIPPIITNFGQRQISSYFRDYAQTQLRVLMAEQTLQQAWERLPENFQENILPGVKDSKLAAQLLPRKLNAGVVYGTTFLTLGASGNVPEGLAELVNTVMLVFAERVQQEEAGIDSSRIVGFRKEREKLAANVEELSNELERIGSKVRTSTFTEQFNLSSKLQNEMQKAWVQAYADLLNKENAYKSIKGQAEQIRKLPIQSLADEMVAGDESLWSISYWTYKTMQEMRATIDGTTSSNPDRRYIEARMGSMKNYETQLKERISARALRIVGDKRDYELDRRVIEARHQFEAALRTEENLREKLNIAEKEVAETSQGILKAQRIAARVEHAREQLFRFDERLGDLAAEAGSGVSRVVIQTFASPPIAPAGNSFKKLLIMCFALSFGSVGCVFLAGDLVDGRIRSPKDMGHAVDGQVSWPISKYDGDFARVSLESPTDVSAKAIRSLADKLNDEHAANGAKIVLFSGAGRECGSTTLALNTAHALTMHSPRVLLAEINSVSHGLSEIMGHDRKAGVPIEESGEHDVAFLDAIMRDEERKIWILFVDESHWLDLEANRFVSVLESLKKSYDFIVIDSGPVLMSDLTEFMARHTDIAVLVGQGDGSLYKNARFSAELFRMLEVPALAAVLNWGAKRIPSSLEKFVARVPLLAKLVHHSRRI
ncbi:GumC family protein [Desulfobaculum bizertense]|uniref:Chromosome partitioning ATPase, Mrp family, contains Fe-S cluster n=1 Tax=Desulfobaculum bizertense DSM 18034 TaxID=1121442 RepID=A0A1T4WQ56_9BACT|nr:hypothetical protein [Desulfobaculum bizertense]SKA78998.1 Chromosome partitioning ATPase, Mrp family, contains Fe-S cluster [Desulfobaculum bizertense DSM 18034]